MPKLFQILIYQGLVELVKCLEDDGGSINFEFFVKAYKEKASPRECCHCCNLGITISKLNLPCGIQVKSIDQRCQSKLTFCCGTHHQPTTKKYKLVQQVTKPFAENFCGAYPEKLCSHICENVPGSFKCRCREGFELLSDNKNCKQIENFCGAYPEKLCSHICENVPGSFKCRCREGFELLSDNKNCKQIGI
ncbi:hypothetical protein HELRODRAFT_158486 [Helobdella robusta]|uniref:EGF-like domain-containing protein n=1 Tax=Helobdella robusta TaxID=6412 RepID=T1EMU8_HELRO|nr:hypothetical protein HELRODRAFT_158486 [Helobdella robusta]ESO12074.1 hypothetical protein HELRODRAFT_158486 [Helobdella robusta]